MSDREALRLLSERYARAVDLRDAAALIEVFHPDARLRVFDPAAAEAASAERIGHDQLATIPVRVSHYTATRHLVGDVTYDVAEEEASGEVHCVAHHLSGGGAETTDLVLHIRYRDLYRRGGDGAWRIAARDVLVDRSELRTASSLDGMGRR